MFHSSYCCIQESFCKAAQFFMKVQLVSKFSAMVRNFYQNCYKPAARFFEPVQQFSCSPGFSFHSRFVFRGSVVSLRSFGLFGGVFAPIFPVSYQVARVNFSKIPKSCKILTSFYCNHSFNVISMAPRGGTLNGADKLFPAVEAAYRRTVDALRAYPAQQR